VTANSAPLSGQRQPQPEPALRARQGPLALDERLEDLRQERRGDPYPCVAHGDGGAITVGAEREGDLAAAGRELGRVVEQVADHLRDPRDVDVRQHPGVGERRPEGDPAFVHQESEVLRGPGHHLAQVDGRAPQLDLSASDARHVEQVVDDP
jgi:hypothetical protein